MKHIALQTILSLSLLCTLPLCAKPRLTDFAKNEYSQWGEDGIIEKVFNIIGTTSKVAIEFGATDGFYFSNTARLWSKQNWKAILIEGNKEHFPQLVQHCQAFNCVPIAEYVGIEEHSSLEAILSKYNITDQIDLLSIDIDGNDYYIFESLKTLRPRVIIVEHNPTLPATLDVYQSYEPMSTNHGFGSSAGALNRIAESKGYKLVCITDTNCFFVLNELFPLFQAFETSLREIQCEKYLKYLISTYTGEYLIIGEQQQYAYNLTSQYRSTNINGSARIMPTIVK